MEYDELTYIILAEQDVKRLCLAVTELMQNGWHLHGELKTQVVTDVSSLTFAGLSFIQALWRERPAYTGED